MKLFGGEPRLMTAKEAAEYLGISLQTLGKADAEIRPYRTSKRRKYSLKMLNQYLHDSKRSK